MSEKDKKIVNKMFLIDDKEYEEFFEKEEN